jgi:hypothetical protein
MARTPDDYHSAWNYAIVLCVGAAIAGLMAYFLSS